MKRFAINDMRVRRVWQLDISVICINKLQQIIYILYTLYVYIVYYLLQFNTDITDIELLNMSNSHVIR